MRLSPAARRTRRDPKNLGFSLIELAVTLVVFSILLVGVLNIFDFNAKLSRSQTQVADLQQNLRIAQAEIVRAVRMAGRGGLPAALFPAAPAYPGALLPQGAAVSVSVAGASTCWPNCATLQVEPGTDILTLRGVFGNLFQINPAGGAFQPALSTVVVSNQIAAFAQPLQSLQQAIGDGNPEAVLLVSNLDDEQYAVVQLVPGASTVTGTPPTSVTLSYLNGSAPGAPPLAQSYIQLSPNGQFPPAMATIAAVGILEEHRYFIRRNPDEAGAFFLSHARFQPNTDTIIGQVDNLVDNVTDLQVALGIDVNRSGVIDGDDSATDEWLFNHSGDKASTQAERLDWSGSAASPLRLGALRISLLALTDRPELAGYVSSPIARIEDHAYSEPATPATAAQRQTRAYRRRILQTVVDLRNL